MSGGRLRVSVAICTLNGTDFLRTQLESILGQSRAPDEVVICDDGSRDGTLDLARDILQSWSGVVRTIQNESRLGYVKNFERAILHTTGDVIFLSDQDDFWLNRKIETMLMPFQESESVGLVYCDAALADAGLRPTGRTIFECRPERRLASKRTARQLTGRHDIGIVGCTLAFRSTLKDALLPIPTSWGHDHWIAFLAHALSEVEPLADPLMYYRRHERNSGYDPGLDGGWLGWWLAGLRASEGNEPSNRKQTARLSRFTGVSRRYLSAVRDGLSTPSYSPVIKHWTDMVERLQAVKSASFSVASQSQLDAFIDECERRLRFMEMRERLRRRGKFERVSCVLRSAVRGDYHLYVRGIRSVFKDLFSVFQ